MKTPALLDGKDLTPEFGWLFDDEKSVRYGDAEMGFVNRIPCIVLHSKQRIIVRLIDYCITQEEVRAYCNWEKTIVDRTREIANGQAYEPVFTQIDRDTEMIQFFWKEKTL